MNWKGGGKCRGLIKELYQNLPGDTGKKIYEKI